MKVKRSVKNKQQFDCEIKISVNATIRNDN